MDTENTGLSLLKKGQKGIFHAVFSRFGLILVLLLLQILFLFSVFRWFAGFLPHIWGGGVLFSAFMVLYLLNQDMDAAPKITWLVVIMLMPVFGCLLYVYTQSNLGHRALEERVAHLIGRTKEAIVQSEETAEAFQKENAGAASLARYLKRSGCYPVYDRTEVTYFPLGEDKFEEMIRQLEQAKQLNKDKKY